MSIVRSAATGTVRRRCALLSLLFLALPAAASADSLRVAVASNFRATAEQIAARFEQESGHRVQLSSASTAKLYAQIVSGAPFDVFLAADSSHPQQLEQRELIVPASRFTYAIGRLVLWSGDPRFARRDCAAALQDWPGGRFAIANPATAPYGRAARQYLAAEDADPDLLQDLVFGESVAQTLHFIATGNAALGVIASSQAEDARAPEASCRVDIDPTLHDPLVQQAVVLKTGNTALGSRFLNYLRSPAVRDLIREQGYEVLL